MRRRAARGTSSNGSFPDEGWHPDLRRARGETWREMADRVGSEDRPPGRAARGDDGRRRLPRWRDRQAMFHWLGIDEDDDRERAWWSPENASITEWRRARTPIATARLVGAGALQRPGSPRGLLLRRRYQAASIHSWWWRRYPLGVNVVVGLEGQAHGESMALHIVLDTGKKRRGRRRPLAPTFYNRRGHGSRVGGGKPTSTAISTTLKGDDRVDAQGAHANAPRCVRARKPLGQRSCMMNHRRNSPPPPNRAAEGDPGQQARNRQRRRFGRLVPPGQRACRK